MTPEEQQQHEIAMVELEGAVDLTMLKVIAISRQINQCPWDDSLCYRKLHADLVKDLDTALKACDAARIAWLKEAQKSWPLS